MPLAGTRVGRRHSCGTGVGGGCHHHPGGRVWDSLLGHFSECPRLDSISLAPPGKLRPVRVPPPRMTEAGSPPGSPRGNATRAHPAFGCSSPGPLQAPCARRFPWQPSKPASFRAGTRRGDRDQRGPAPARAPPPVSQPAVSVPSTGPRRSPEAPPGPSSASLDLPSRAPHSPQLSPSAASPARGSHARR